MYIIFQAINAILAPWRSNIDIVIGQISEIYVYKLQILKILMVCGVIESDHVL